MFIMFTSRKRARPNPSLGEGNSTTSLPVPSQRAPSNSSLGPTSSSDTPISASSNRDTTMADDTRPAPTNQIRKSRSWYDSWPRKSTPSTQVARENIMGGTLRSRNAPDFSRFDVKSNSDASTDADADARSVRTLTKISENKTDSQTDGKVNSQINGVETSKNNGAAPKPESPDQKDGAENGHATSSTSKAGPFEDSAAQAPPSTGWLAWLSRSSIPEEPTVEPVQPESEMQPETQAEITDDRTTNIREPDKDPSLTRPETPKAQSTGSWFGFWTAPVVTTPTASIDITPKNKEIQIPKESTTEEGNTDVVMQDASSPTAPSKQPSAGSTWAFWSRDSPKTNRKAPAPPEQGELAVMGDGSEASPRRTAGVDVADDTSSLRGSSTKSLSKGSQEDATAKGSPAKKSKRLRPKSMDLDDSSTIRPSTAQSETSTKESPSKATAPTQNLLLPSFKSTYRMKENPSIIKQIAQMLLRAQQPPANHVFLVKEPPKIRKAVAIGVHGLFPASYLRPMVGQPTGTSIRFANHGADAIRRWADTHGCGDCEIEKIALEGEGKIADRVDNLWKLMLNWIEHIRKADLIMLACHSQGVPVGLMLLAKLIDLGIISTARIGVCAMAGVSLGPFPDYKSGMGMLMGSASELWQFGDPESEVSKRYEHALEVIVNYGGRITYVGSIDDQVVPMESAVYSPASHPYIYRAVFIDGRVHASDFIAHLVGFALKLRNLGISDHGLVRELSIPLAGSLYSGEGHSRLYDDEQVYDLAVTHALETSTTPGVACQIEKHEGLTNPNPYILPWIMRGLLEEEFVKTELYAETAELLNQFDNWKPTTKALKDVKYRLEAVRSRL